MRQQAKQEYAHLRQKIQDELSHFPELSEEIKELLKEAHERDVTTGHRRIAGSILHFFFIQPVKTMGRSKPQNNLTAFGETNAET